MSQPKNSTAAPAVQQPEALVTMALPFRAAFTGTGLPLFSVQPGVASRDALNEASNLVDVAIGLLEEVDPSGSPSMALIHALRCLLIPAKYAMDAVWENMSGPQFFADAPEVGGEA